MSAKIDKHINEKSNVDNGDVNCETDEGRKHTACSPESPPAAGFSSPTSKPTSISEGKSESKTTAVVTSRKTRGSVEKVLELNAVVGGKAAISTSDGDGNSTVSKKRRSSRLTPSS
eukprot:3607102-Ditylum_brightwellii.AAC.1